MILKCHTGEGYDDTGVEFYSQQVNICSTGLSGVALQKTLSYVTTSCSMYVNQGALCGAFYKP